MNCAEAEELVGAYALDALPEAEAARMREHLASCAEHAAKVAALRAVASYLPAAEEVAPPPAGLRRRVVDAVAAEASKAGDTPVRLRPARRWQPAASPVRAWMGVAAVLVAAVGGLLAWNIVLLNRDGAGLQQLAARATAARPLIAGDQSGPVGTVLYFADERRAVVVADGLGELDASQSYQLWAIADGAPQSLGLMRAGARSIVVPFDASRQQQLAVTIEAAGGSDTPHGPPVASAAFGS